MIYLDDIDYEGDLREVAAGNPKRKRATKHQLERGQKASKSPKSPKAPTGKRPKASKAPTGKRPKSTKSPTGKRQKSTKSIKITNWKEANN